MTRCLLNIDFGQAGNSAEYTKQGWAEQGEKHRWTLGREARLLLPLEGDGADFVLAISATPCRNLPDLQGQAVMIALGDRLLAATDFPGLRTYAFRLPRGVARPGGTVLSITHLNYMAPRAENQFRLGEPLGLMVHSIRLYHVSTDVPRPPAFAVTPANEQVLALRFESIGQGCQFGLIQRQMGAVPLSLLRFVDSVTSFLIDGLVNAFAGVDRPGRLDLHHTDKKRPTYRWHQLDYGLSFDTLIHVDEMEPEKLIETQLRRLTFLRRKFMEDLRAGEKIYVQTRSDCLTEPEALAVFCALNIHGPNTLLWSVFGDENATGRLDEVAPGFLCGQLGWTDEDRYAPLEAWRALLNQV